MRKLIFAALLAGIAISPALAQDWRDHDRGRRQQDSGSADEQAPQPARRIPHVDGGGLNRPAAEPQVEHRPPVIVEGAPTAEPDPPRSGRGDDTGVQRPRFEGRPAVIVEQGERGRARPRFGGPAGRDADEQQPYRRYGGFGPRRDPSGSAAPQAVVPQQSYPRYGRTEGQPQQADQSRQWNRDGATWNGQRNWTGQNRYYGQRQGVQPQVRDGTRWASGGWNRDWRNDRRYDWRRYREGHRSAFRIGIYYDPFGYNYQPLQIGYRLMPAYFGQQNWINDPWDYRLPPPPPGTVWVRYWNDALLVDMYSGEVMDAIRNFFW